MSGQPIGVVLFDWNGTLVDDTTRACDAVNIVLAELHLQELPDKTAFRERFVLPLDQWMSSLGVPERHIRRAVSRWNDEVAARDAPARQGAHELLERLRDLGYSSRVISAASTDAVRADADALGLRPLVDQIEGDANPKRAAIGAACDGFRRGRSFYVGDTEYDIAEGLAAGAIPIGITTGYRPAAALSAAGAHHVVERLEEILLLVSPTVQGCARS